MDDGAAQHAAVRALRAARQRKRLVSLEWFEVAYKVYLAAIVVIGAVVVVSNLVGDDPLSASQVDDLRRQLPGLVGLAFAVALAFGARSGARGGPLAVEAADVHHLLLAPVPRCAVLLRPAVQQVRLALFAGVGTGAVAGQLLGRRLQDSLLAWAASGAAAGATVALTFVAVALLAHGLHVRRWQASLVAALSVGWQAASLPDRSRVPGPFDSVGHLVLWPLQVAAVDVVIPLAVVAATAVGLALLERFSVDALARRSALVAQLKFAVTVRDLRTVVLLRRQLSNEQHRPDPWFPVGRWLRAPVAARGAHSIARFPAARLVRMTLLTAVIAAAQVAAFRGTTPAVVVSGLAAFVLGLECLEPFAQEIDQPDRCDGLPHERGWVLVRHLPVPAAVAALFGLLGTAGVLVAERTTLAWELAPMLMLPVVWAGLAGAVLNVMAGLPDPVTTQAVNELLPPEVAGMKEVFRTVRPLIVAVVGSVPVLAARAAHEAGRQPVPPALQVCVIAGLLIAFVAWWTRRRDEMRAKFRNLWSAGDAEFRARQAAKAGHR